jgi:hypothetical protein
MPHFDAASRMTNRFCDILCCVCVGVVRDYPE